MNSEITDYFTVKIFFLFFYIRPMWLLKFYKMWNYTKLYLNSELGMLKLPGRNLFLYWNEESLQRICKLLAWLSIIGKTNQLLQAMFPGHSNNLSEFVL